MLWRLLKVGREHARAVMLPGGPPYTLAFFANDQLDRVENFDAIDMAIFRADGINQSLTADGWYED